jgi:nitrate/nitrite transporter NarK
MVRRRRAVNISLIVVCQSMQSLTFGGIALFLPLIRKDIGLDFAQSGTLAVATTLIYALMQIPSGYLADRFGAKRLFVTGLLGTSALAFSFSVLHSYELLLVNQALAGFFRALIFAPGLLLISAQFPTERRATAMGLYVAGGFSSNIFLNSLGPVLVHPLGWRNLFAIFACVGLLIVVGYWIVGEGEPNIGARQHVRIRELGPLFRHPVLWLAGGIQFVRLAVANGLNFWLPSFIVSDRGFSLSTAGFVVAIGAAVTAPANFLGGYLSDRIGRPTAVISTSLSVLAVGIALLANVHSLPLLIAVVAMNAIFVQVYFGPLFGIPVQVFGTRTAGLTSGFGNFCANMGGLTFAYTLGALKDSTGSFAIGLYSLSGMCVVGLGISIVLARVQRAALEARAAEAAANDPLVTATT